VDISKALADTLARLEVARKEEKLKYDWDELPLWVFCSKEGTPLEDWTVRKAMTIILKKTGVSRHFTPHCLRHTYASLMLQQGESPAYVQRQLGHASIQLTVDTYGKWLPMGNKAAVDRLDDYQSGSKMVAAAAERQQVSMQVLEKMVPPTRIERATNGLGNRCSIRLSYGGIWVRYRMGERKSRGNPG
jgi:integrase